ncbi:hypothetical protein DCAR_0312913 [Daucus carota subsp. sativus]|uniref:Uncharacterized protein n=1 Tax=Daucus carota subsp. sativus TaxID=79200 RepID=A0A166BN91_DAUCS|nr:PREDICTED: miraculin-like [Daucus carota subsp. sativus]WOG93627.1 hypothetical protein DCAR_0312913 [Daucus carota subsp. sativus]
MKNTNVLLSTLVVLIITNLQIIFAATDAVLDTDGQELHTGTKYYILPVVRGNGGGLKLYSGRTSECPSDVVQEGGELNNGVPVTFFPVNPNETTVRASTDLNIEFSGGSACPQSTVWRLDGGDAGSNQRFVSTGGVIGNPGSDTLSNWFKIERLEGNNNWYKLVFCPGVCDICRPVCGDLGILIEKSGTRRLALNTEKAFQVFFKKA